MFGIPEDMQLPDERENLFAWMSDSVYAVMLLGVQVMSQVPVTMVEVQENLRGSGRV